LILPIKLLGAHEIVHLLRVDLEVCDSLEVCDVHDLGHVLTTLKDVTQIVHVATSFTLDDKANYC